MSIGKPLEHLTDEHGHDGPTLDPILRVHRAQDGYVTFHKMRDDTMVDDCAVRVKELETLFPQFRAELERDAYFSLNSFYRPNHGAGIAGLPRAFRKALGARYLNACFTDIDCHERAFDFGTMVGRVFSLQDQNLIPPASIIVRSGRGLWLMWILIDQPGTHLPPTAHAHRRLLWSALQAELGKRLAHLGADRAARDVSRIARVPGSLNSKSQSRVVYIFPASADGNGFAYTMEFLANFLGVSIPAPPVPKNGRATARTPASQRAANGYAAAAQYRLEDFQQLRELRGGFQQGTRNNAVFIFAWLLRANRFDDATIEKEVARLGRECHPPLSAADIRKAIGQGKRKRKMTDALLADKLAATPHEAELIPRFSSGVPPDVAPVNATPAVRRRIILAIVETANRRFSCRDISTLLARRGITATRMTVSRDLKHLFKTRKPPSLQAPLPLSMLRI